MKECTETDKQGLEKPQVSTDDKTGAYHPMVSIVLATYNPRMDWLKEQLASLNNQSYESLELLILDDCSTSVSMETIEECVQACITKIPVRIFRNDVNLGSTKTFEKLTQLAEGEYIAYCDQDDIWHDDKIQCYLTALENSEASLVFSDVNIIDDAGKKIADSITKIRKHHIFQSGGGLAKILLFKNFVIGCAMMIKATRAKDAIPFCPHLVHDHWLALHSAVKGEIKFIKEPLIYYRVHEKNQTLMLSGVVDKDSYLKIRIEEALQKFLWLQDRYREDPELSQTIAQAIEWMKARRDHFKGAGKTAKTIWKYRKFSYLPSMFELIAARFPEKLFMYFIELGRKNIL